MTAIEIAIEALRKSLDWIGTADDETHELGIASALAALTAEPSPVPPDRERLRLAEVLDAVARIVIDGGPASDDIRAAAALLRQPAPAEVDGYVDSINQMVGWIREGSIDLEDIDIDELLSVAALLRRLALPAVGDWRPISAEQKRIKEELEYRLNEFLCEMKPNWDDSITGFNDACDVVRKYFAALPSPPIPEEPKP